MIKPTVGRVVWFWPMLGEAQQLGLTINDPAQPFAATVTYVWNDRLVNLSIVDHNGKQFGKTGVSLLQEGDIQSHWGRATWMPYQQAQAKKVDA